MPSRWMSEWAIGPPTGTPSTSMPQRGRAAAGLSSTASVCSTFLCRRRYCIGTNVSICQLCFAFNNCHGWNRVQVDKLFNHVVRYNGKELHLDMCFRLGQICQGGITRSGEGEEVGNISDKSDDEENKRWRRGWSYILPRRIFPCMALRTLCASHCRLKLPEIVNLPFLERLHITAAAVIGGVTSKC
ncbi:hypothetical protein QYE76_018843 [Lolium multiflorum]|uniref:Uncharacterized protein n=1 Tax=Lolium multiflorum TaxID=4521 RepID=A0AAD8QGP2_LOLMU|nr:hypothetical protein QYE76_018843 [Lolium multiflorum]